MANDPIASLFIDLRAGLERLQSDMNSAVGVVEGAAQKIEGIGKNIQRVFQGALVITGVAAVKQLGQAVYGLEQQLVGLARHGAQAEGISRAFQMLGGSVPQIQAAQAAIRGLVDDTGLMRAANRALLAEIPGVNENFALLADLGARVGIATGQSAKDGIDGLISALESAKPKQLAQYGIIIDTEKALIAYTGGVKEATKYLSDLEKRQALQIAAQEQLKTALDKLGPPQESVIVAYDRMSNALDQLWEDVGKVINQNPDLMEAFGNLEKLFGDEQFVNSIKEIADYIATLTAKIIELGTQALKYVEAVKNAKPTNTFLGSLIPGHTEAQEHAKQLIQQQIDAASGKAPPSLAGFGATVGMRAGAPRPLEQFGPPVPGWLLRQRDAEDAAAEKLRQKIQGVREEWEKLLLTSQQRGIDDQIKDAIEALDGTSFQSAVADMGKLLNKELSEKVADAIADGYKPTPEQIAGAKAGIDLALGEYREQWNKASEENAKKLAEDQKRAFEESVDFFGDIFSAAIDGSAEDIKAALERILKEVAVGFASQIAASLTGGFSVQGGIGGIGQAIAASLGFGGPGGGGGPGGSLLGGAAAGGGLGSIIGSFGMSGATASAAGIAGPAMESGAFIEGSGLLGALGPYGAAAAAALIIGGVAAHKFGVFGGTKNEDSRARMQFGGFFEDKGLKIFDSEGNLKEIDNFITGAHTRFNDPRWGDGWKRFDEKAKESFEGAGAALEAFLGIGEGLGDQFGLLLAENFESVDNLRFVFQQLGIEVDALKEKIIEAGLEGDESLSAIWGKLKGAEAAAGAGLVGQNDVAGAFAQFLGSEGKGKTPLLALQNLATESLEGIAEAMKKLGLSEKDVKVLFDELEKGTYTVDELKKFLQDTGRYGAAGIEELFQAIKEGAPTLDALKEKLTASGQFDPKDIEAFFAALQNMGVTTLQQFADMNTGTAIGVVANAEALGLKWKEVAESIGEAADQQERFNAAAGQTPIPTVSGVRDTEKFALGGVVSRPTIGLMGEAGPEAILPLTRGRGGRLGVSMHGAGRGNFGTIVVNVDAPYSAPGQEVHIADVVQEAVERSLAAVADGVRRGGSFGSLFGG